MIHDIGSCRFVSCVLSLFFTYLKVPSLSADEANDILAIQAGHALSNDEWCSPELQILTMINGDDPLSNLGNGYHYALVWKVCPNFVGQGQQTMEGYVDAKNGNIYSFVDKIDYFSSTGSVYPISNDGQLPGGVLQVREPMAFMQVGSETTDSGGNYFKIGSQTGVFAGPYVNIQDKCGRASLTGSSGLDWGSHSGTDCKKELACNDFLLLPLSSGHSSHE